MGKQLSLSFREIDNTGVEYVTVLGSVYSGPATWSIKPTVFLGNYFIAKKRLNDGFPMQLLVSKIDDNTK